MNHEEPTNYFAPPETDVTASGREAPVGEDALATIRREYLPHEIQVRAVSQYFLVFCGLLGAAGLVLIFDLDGPWIGLVVLIGSVGSGAIGMALRGLRGWARLVVFAGSAVFMGLLLFGIVQSIGRASAGRVLLLLATSAIPWWLIRLTATPAATLVFSPEYRDVVRRTPKLRPVRLLTDAIREGVTLGFVLLLLIFWLILGLRVR